MNESEFQELVDQAREHVRVSTPPTAEILNASQRAEHRRAWSRAGLAAGATVVVIAAAFALRPATPPSLDPPPTDDRTATPDAPTPRATSTAGPEYGNGIESPPPYRLRYADRELVLRPHSWCYKSACVNGSSENPPSVGRPSEVSVFVPIEHTRLLASFAPADQRCGRIQTVRPTRTDEGWYVLRPAGHAGAYDVDLFAEGGSMSASFRWITPSDGELPTPQATLALIAEHDGQPDSYGVELHLRTWPTPRAPRPLA
jgi:hypothetical protein